MLIEMLTASISSSYELCETFNFFFLGFCLLLTLFVFGFGVTVVSTTVSWTTVVFPLMHLSQTQTPTMIRTMRRKMISPAGEPPPELLVER